MNLFPFYEDIDGKTFLIVGGGAVARHKIRVLRQFTDRILILAEKTEITDCPVIQKRFEPDDLRRGDYVIAATGNPETDRRIAALCRETGKKINVVDEAKLCTFFFPSIVKRGPLVVAISTCGASPAYAKKLRQRVEKAIPQEIESVLNRMEEVRTWVPGLLKTQRERAVLYQWLLNALLAGETISEEEIRRRALDGSCQHEAERSRKRAEESESAKEHRAEGNRKTAEDRESAKERRAEGSRKTAEDRESAEKRGSRAETEEGESAENCRAEAGDGL